ncbi:electron transport complex subunit RsxB [Rhodanobacter sp. K2T2]|uniref:electron transport complex subunit RsxB n=1 Tax=Rhodanobacter sp. K2T2 TaxID=2723085 RepID=UPI0031F2DDBD
MNIESSFQTLADRIDAILPQTQCEQCGYHGCRPYAEAIARGEASINQCPPGGAAGIERLASLLNRPIVPLDPDHGVEKPRALARIVEADCIGCTKCIQACPVDAIVGASKVMHTVIADDCTGCELCVPACPVDCIVLLPMPATQIDQAHADAAREHFQRREARLERQRRQRDAELAAHKAAVGERVAQRNPVLEALARAKAKKPTTNP